MNGVNFIPMQRRALAGRRARLRAWAIGVGAYAFVAAVGYAVSATVAVGDDETVVARLQELPGEIDKTRRAIASVQAQTADEQAKLDAARAVTEQPDWSVVLSLLAQSLGDEIVLTSCQLDTQAESRDDEFAPSPSPVRGTAPRGRQRMQQQEESQKRVALQITGLGRTQSSVSQFVLRLEQVGLFERVTILKTGRAMLGDQEVIGFRVEATIGEPPGNGNGGDDWGGPRR